MKTLSLFVIVAAGAAGADLNVPAASGAFLLHGVQAWRFSEGRQEMIPEFAATLDNQTGEDWRNVVFKINVPCPGREQQSYVAKVANVEPGPRAVRVTAYDAFDRVSPCAGGGVSVEFLSGEPLPADQRPSYVVLGFSYQDGEPPPSLELEGIFDTRRDGDSMGPTRPIFWRDGGEKLAERPGPQPAAYYALRVEAGDFGFSGFLRSRDTNNNSGLDHFIRWYTVPPGKAVFLGTFQMERSPYGLLTVVASKDPEGFAMLKERSPTVRGRELILPPPRPADPVRTRIQVK